MAPAIPVDSQTHAYISGYAAARGISLAQAVRSLAGLDEVSESPPRPVHAAPSSGASRQPRVQLGLLREAGLLRNGQTLYLHDFRGQRVEGAECAVYHENLKWKNKQYSMSRLAGILLKAEGYQADSVRGPAHWYTEEGVRITDLWEKYLRGTEN